MDVAAWLRGVGLPQYEQTFRDKAIDAEVLPQLTDEHLKELGLPLGHRLRLLNAIATLNDSANNTALPTARGPTNATICPPVTRSPRQSSARWRRNPRLAFASGSI